MVNRPSYHSNERMRKDLVDKHLSIAKTNNIDDWGSIIHNFPSLSDDLGNFDLIKSVISMAALGGRVKLVEQIGDAVEFCIDRDIPKTRVLEFFQSELMIKLLIQSINSLEFTESIKIQIISEAISKLEIRVLKQNNIVTSESEFLELDNIFREYELAINDDSKSPSNLFEELKDKFTVKQIENWKNLNKKKICFFQMDHHYKIFSRKYDPNNAKYTISSFIKHLEKRYTTNLVTEWLLLREYKFHELIRLNIGKFLDKKYSDLMNNNPEKFLKMIIPEYILIEDENIIFDNEGLKILFDELVEQLNNGIGVLELRKILKELCISYISKHDFKSFSFFDKRGDLIINDISELVSLHDSNEERIRLRVLDKDSNNNEYEIVVTKSFLIDFLEKQITMNFGRLELHYFDEKDFLIDPKNISLKLQYDYDYLFQNGKLNYSRYVEYLMNSIGLPDQAIEDLEEELREIYNEINNYINIKEEKLSSQVLQSERVSAASTYHELLKLACTSNDLIESFEARRKIELAILLRRAKNTRNIAFIKKDLEKIVESFKMINKLYIVDEKYREKTLYFVDEKKNNNIRELIGSELDKARKENGDFFDLNSEIVFKAKFDGIDCYVSNPKYNIKTIISYLNKKILKPGEEVLDTIRFTIIVDDNNLEAIREKLDRIVRNGVAVRVVERGGKNDANKHTSDDFKAINYKMQKRVRSHSGESYNVPVEIQLQTVNGFIAGKSKYHSASHSGYKKRQESKQIEILYPQEIYDDVLYEEVFDLDDIFAEIAYRLKSVLENI